MGVVVKEPGGGFKVSDKGIRSLLAGPSYNLTDTNHGGTLAYRGGLGMRPTPRK